MQRIPGERLAFSVMQLAARGGARSSRGSIVLVHRRSCSLVGYLGAQRDFLSARQSQLDNARVTATGTRRGGWRSGRGPCRRKRGKFVSIVRGADRRPWKRGRLRASAIFPAAHVRRASIQPAGIYGNPCFINRNLITAIYGAVQSSV